MKACSRCEKVKDDSAFQIRKASPDGMTAACKECLSKYDKSRANLPRRVEARACYQQTERGRERSAEAKRKFSLRHPAKRKAHIIVGNCLRDGKLERPERCDNCKCECKPQAHHSDYGKPLDVEWLCVSCHVDWHKHNTPIYPLLI